LPPTLTFYISSQRCKP